MKYIEILKNPENNNIDKEQLNYLKSIIESYPYIQSSRALYSKALKKFKYHDFFSKNIYPISKPIIKLKHKLSRFFKKNVLIRNE